MILRSGVPLRVTDFPWGRCYQCDLPPADWSKWAWLADTHVSRHFDAEHDGWRPAEQLARIAGEVAVTQPCGVVVNGDLAWSRGHIGDYRQFRSILDRALPTTPLVLGVGNHDHRGNLLMALAERHPQPPARLVTVVAQPPYRLVVLDSQADPDDVGGEIGSEQIDWLGALLRGTERLRTVLFVHHPGVSASEGCRDFEALVQTAEPLPWVEAIVTGHDHEFTLEQAHPLPRIGLPAAGFPFKDGSPCGWVEANLSPAGMDLRLHATSGQTGFRLPWRARSMTGLADNPLS